MKINELISEFTIWTSKEEATLLGKLHDPIKLCNLAERDQVIANSLIRKSLVKKIGQADPVIVVNETNNLSIN